jgi:hypothetical protein
VFPVRYELNCYVISRKLRLLDEQQTSSLFGAHPKDA